MSRLLDILGTRLGTLFAACFLMCLCAASLYLLRFNAETIRKTDTLFEMHEIRKAFVTVNDLARLNAVLTEIDRAPQFGPDEEQRLMAALDMLHVRLHDLQSKAGQDSPFAMTKDAVQMLSTLIDAGDSALRLGITDKSAFVTYFGGLIDIARREIFIQPQKMEELERSMVTRQTSLLQNITSFSIFAITTFALLGIAGLALLHREIAARHSRDKAESRARFLAYFDPLTELPNRLQFQDYVDNQISQNQAGALAIIDLDHFKKINDSFGQAMGDLVLHNVGKAFQNEVQKHGGFAARLAGDEFAAFLPVEDPLELRRIGDAVINCCSAPVVQGEGGDSVQPAIRVGIAATQQASTKNADYEDILKLADFALYVAKEAGAGTVAIYDSALEAQYLERRAILDDLPHAIQNGDLEVYFQPKVRMQTFEVYGFEALVRWRRNNKLIRPDIFIRLAEEVGLVTDIDLYVLHNAACQLADWNLSNGTSLTVSANLSALHFNSRTIVDSVRAILKISGLEPHLLTLEITESEQLHNWEGVRHILSDLHALGCKISIDDFGTGYSSLAYLRAMPADELKIDKSLIDQIENSLEVRFVLDAIVDLAKGLEMSVVVEGIETEEQAEIISKMGIFNGQGFLFGRPVPALEALATITPPQETLHL